MFVRCVSYIRLTLHSVIFCYLSPTHKRTHELHKNKMNANKNTHTHTFITFYLWLDEKTTHTNITPSIRTEHLICSTILKHKMHGLFLLLCMWIYKMCICFAISTWVRFSFSCFFFVRSFLASNPVGFRYAEWMWTKGCAFEIWLEKKGKSKQ